MDELQRKKQQMKSDGGVDCVIAAQTGSEVKSPERGSVFNDRQQKLKRRGEEEAQGGEASLTIFNDER